MKRHFCVQLVGEDPGMEDDASGGTTGDGLLSLSTDNTGASGNSVPPTRECLSTNATVVFTFISKH